MLSKKDKEDLHNAVFDAVQKNMIPIFEVLGARNSSGKTEYKKAKKLSINYKLHHIFK